MFRDERVLDDEVVPERELVVHRRDELQALLDDLRPFGRLSGQLYLIGPPGSGKTMLGRLALTLLEDDYSVTTSYVSCWRQHEEYDILFRLASDLCTGPYHRTSTPRSELIDDLDAEPDTSRVVILDEIDQLADHEILYTLHSFPDLKAVYIANSEEQLFHSLDDRVQSRVSVGGRHYLEEYSVNQLTEILSKRAKYAFTFPESVVSRQQLETIASAAAGDARHAIMTLHRAAKIAIQDERGVIEDADIDIAITDARAELRRKSVDQLNDHQRVLYELIEERGPIEPSDLYEAYAESVDNARVQRTVRRYLTKMEHYNLIESSGQRSAKTYSAHSITE